MHPSSWLVCHPDASGDTRLFCFPFAGGTAATFLPWQELLGPRVELHVAQLPGRGNRLFETPVTDQDVLVAELTSAVAALTDTRFVLFGHSLGALPAFEGARELRRRGHRAPESLWVAGAEGPQTQFVKNPLHGLTDDEFIAALRDYNGTPTELLDDREMMGLLLPGLRADFTVGECYRYRPDEPLDVPIHVLLADHDEFTDPDRAAGWERETSRALRQYVYPGDHFFLLPHEAAITARLAAALTSGAPR